MRASLVLLGARGDETVLVDGTGWVHVFVPTLSVGILIPLTKIWTADPGVTVAVEPLTSVKLGEDCSGGIQPANGLCLAWGTRYR